MKRNDRYTPSNIAPQEFTFLLWYHAPLKSDDWPIPAFMVDAAIATYNKGGTHIHGGIFNCDVCGAHFKEGELWQHESGDIVSIGHQCAAKYNLYMDLSAYKSQKSKEIRKAKRQAERAYARGEMRLYLRRHPGLGEALRADHDITRDIRARFIKWGNVSDKQIELVFKLQRQVAEQAQMEEAEAELVIDVPEGRQVIEGTVLSIKWRSTPYGDTLKMLVKVESEDGMYKVWGTVPSAIGDIERNAVIKFTATIKCSNDKGFGFFSRPSKASVVEANEVVA